MNFKKWMVLCMAVCLFTLPLLGGCQKKELEDTRDDKYIVMQFIRIMKKWKVTPRK